jgi:hypothetical protein
MANPNETNPDVHGFAAVLAIVEWLSGNECHDLDDAANRRTQATAEAGPAAGRSALAALARGRAGGPGGCATDGEVYYSVPAVRSGRM